MKKTKLVFSLVREQSVFMTVVISILTFLSVLALGIALSIGSGVVKWNDQWNKYATVQVMNPDNVKSVTKVLNDNSDKIESVKEISKNDMERMMQPWITSGAKIKDYLPTMYEIKIKNKSDVDYLREQISPRAKFLVHTSALKTTMSAGWKIVTITLFVLILILASIGICISYISQNIAMLHKHELEILNQVGANDNFIVRQMQIIVGKISMLAGFIGFITAIPFLYMIIATAQSARVGLMATLSLNGASLIALMLLPIIMVVFSVYITKKTTIKILSRN